MIGRTFCVKGGIIEVADHAVQEVLYSLILALQITGTNYWGARVEPALRVFFPGLKSYGIPASMLKSIKLATLDH